MKTIKTIKNTTIHILVLTLAFSSMFAQTGSPKTNASKPNIIFILADDLGIGGISAYGSDNYRTPNIDKLAQEGMRFNKAYTVPLCGPSRAMILTGRYGFRTGAVNQDLTGEMKPSVETFMPTVLKSAGYVSTSVGKWGQLPLLPSDFGFDDYLRYRGSGVYWNKDGKKEKYLVNGAEKTLGDSEYMPDLLHTHLLNFIEKNKDKPFYAYYSLSSVHGDIQPTPDSKADSKDLYADNIVYMDKLVGQLIAELERMKLLENTLIVFMGDNGTANKPAKNDYIGGKLVKGAKGSMEEGGSLVPFIANWKGKIAPGQMTDQLIDSSDLLPTFVELAEAKLPTKNVIDGQSFAPQLLGKKATPRDWIFIELGNKWFVREAKFKLNRDGELFDMSKSPFAESLIPADSTNPEAIAARKRMEAVLAKLNPAGGVLDDGDGSGRARSKAKQPTEEVKKDNKKDKKKAPN